MTTDAEEIPDIRLLGEGKSDELHDDEDLDKHQRHVAWRLRPHVDPLPYLVCIIPAAYVLLLCGTGRRRSGRQDRWKKRER